MSDLIHEASPVLVDRINGVLQITINSPSNRNSISTPGVLEGLHSGLDQLGRDDALRCAIITGAGGSFCSGGDLKQLSTNSEAETLARMTANATLYRRIANCEKTVIAAVDGAAYGAGLGLAACCDLIVAGETARFCCVFVRIGAMPDAGLFWSLPLRVGVAKARQLMLFADEINGTEAFAIGLADRIASSGSALPAAHDLAQRLVKGPGKAHARIKQGLRDASGSLEDALTFQLAHAPALFASDDFKEGVNSFFEKRKPTFSGR